MPRASKTGVTGLYRNADGRYYFDLRWQHPRTREHLRHREMFKVGLPLAAAKRRAQALLSSALDGTFIPGVRDKKPETFTVGPSFDRYLDSQRERGLRSVASQVTHGKAIKKALGDERDISSLVPLDVDRLKKQLREQGCGPATINRHLMTLSGFLRWASRKEKSITRDLADELREMEKPKEPSWRKRYVREDEEPKLATLTGWLRPLVDMIRLSGMRLGEATSLRWINVDLRAAEITVTGTKSDKDRTICIQPALRTLLDALPRGAVGDYVLDVPRGESRPGAKRTEKQRRRDYASVAFARWAERAGLEDLHLHDLRHDYATRVLAGGASLIDVKDALGHSTVAVTQRYAHATAKSRAAAVAFLTIPVAQPIPAEGVAQVIQLAANGSEVAGKQGDSERRRADSNRCVKVLQAVPASPAIAAENSESPVIDRRSEPEESTD